MNNIAFMADKVRKIFEKEIQPKIDTFLINPHSNSVNCVITCKLKEGHSLNVPQKAILLQYLQLIHHPRKIVAEIHTDRIVNNTQILPIYLEGADIKKLEELSQAIKQASS